MTKHCIDCREAETTVTCDDAKGRCKACATDADFCWSCGREGDLCFGSDECPMPDEYRGACRWCVKAWEGTRATEAYHSHLWDVGR